MSGCLFVRKCGHGCKINNLSQQLFSQSRHVFYYVPKIITIADKQPFDIVSMTEIYKSIFFNTLFSSIDVKTILSPYFIDKYYLLQELMSKSHKQDTYYIFVTYYLKQLFGIIIKYLNMGKLSSIVEKIKKYIEIINLGYYVRNYYSLIDYCIQADILEHFIVIVADVPIISVDNILLYISKKLKVKSNLTEIYFSIVHKYGINEIYASKYLIDELINWNIEQKEKKIIIARKLIKSCEIYSNTTNLNIYKCEHKEVDTLIELDFDMYPEIDR
jgi:hypothetical protein